MPPAWPETIGCGQVRAALEYGRKTGFPQGEIAKGFWPPFETGQLKQVNAALRAGLYARVSTHDQQTIPLQTRALREYVARRGWTIAVQVKEVGSGASQRELREKLLEAARRREIDVVLVWRLDRWGRSVTDLLATLQELEHLGVGFVSLTEALDLTTPGGSSDGGLAGGLLRVRKGDSPGTGTRRLGPCPAERETSGPTGNCGPKAISRRGSRRTTACWLRKPAASW